MSSQKTTMYSIKEGKTPFLKRSRAEIIREMIRTRSMVSVEVESKSKYNNDHRTQSDRQKYCDGNFGDIPHDTAENGNRHCAEVTDGKHPGGDPVDVVRVAQQWRESKNEDE